MANSTHGVSVSHSLGIVHRIAQPVRRESRLQFAPQNSMQVCLPRRILVTSSLRNLGGTGMQRISTADRPSSVGMLLKCSSSSFFEGDCCNIRSFLPAIGKFKLKTIGTRAAADDVPSYKGFPPMTKKPKWWWRVLACLPYLMPLAETWMYAETAYSLHPFLEDYEFCTYPFLAVIGQLPGWFLLAYFFAAYLGIVRNNKWPHFFRFHVVTGMLLEIILQVAGTTNEWFPKGVYWGKIGAHFWLAISFAFLFTVLLCIKCALRGMYADVPFISDASYMQIPYE